MEFFLVRIFLYSDWIFSPNIGKYGPEKTPYLDTFHAVKTLQHIHRNPPFQNIFFFRPKCLAKYYIEYWILKTYVQWYHYLHDIDIIILQCFYKHNNVSTMKMKGSWNITSVFAFLFSFLLKRPSSSGINKSTKEASAWKTFAWKTSGFIQISDG